MAKKSKLKTAAPSALNPPLPSLKTQNQNKKAKTVTLPQPSVDEEDSEEGQEEGDFDDDSVDEEEDDDDEEDSDSEDDGIDQEGMERLVKLLGEDGLDDFDRAQLRSMAGEEDEDEDEEDSADDEEAEEGAGDDDEEEEDISDEDEENDISLVKVTINNSPSPNEEQEDEEEDPDAIPLDEIESILDEDAVPKQKLEIDNQVALERIRQTIQLDPSLPWTETLVLTYPQKIEVDVNDDLNRELAFYKQALHSAQSARTLSIKHNLPFTRPSDYFAEMVKSDSHMERIRQRLLNETASIKKSEEKRKEREGKKFGKQVQMEKLKEREREKKDMQDRLKNLKRKRKDMLDNSKEANAGDDDFDVAVEDAISDRPSKRNKSSSSSSSSQKSRMPRHARDKKFGFGGAGRRSKQNTKQSTDSFTFGGGRGKKGAIGGGKKGGKKQRPGKARRMTARSK